MVQFGDVYRFAKYKLQVFIFTHDLEDYTKFVLAGYIKIKNVKSVTNNTFCIIFIFWFSINHISLYNLIHLTFP